MTFYFSDKKQKNGFLFLFYFLTKKIKLFLRMFLENTSIKER